MLRYVSHSGRNSSSAPQSPVVVMVFKSNVNAKFAEHIFSRGNRHNRSALDCSMSLACHEEECGSSSLSVGLYQITTC